MCVCVHVHTNEKILLGHNLGFPLPTWRGRGGEVRYTYNP